MKEEEFPIDVFPKHLKEYCIELSECMDVNPDMVACSMLPVLAGAIGASRKVCIKSGHEEPAIIWVVIVAKSGYGKTPVLNELLKPLLEIDDELYRQYRNELEEHKMQKAAKISGIIEPKQKSILIRDTTIEALATILENNPEGIVIFRDEMAGFFASLGQYNNARQADESFILEMFNGGSARIDRKDKEKSVRVSSSVASIIGGTQPSVLQQIFKSHDWLSGFAARFLIFLSSGTSSSYTNKTVSLKIQEKQVKLIRKLYNLRFQEPSNKVIEFDDKALNVYINWANISLKPKIDKAEEALAASLSKLRTYVPRIALVLQCCKNPDSKYIKDDVVADAIKIVDYFMIKIENLHSNYSSFSPKDDSKDIFEFIENNNDFVTPRDLSRFRRKYGKANSARRRLLELTKDGKLGMVCKDGDFGFEIVY